MKKIINENLLSREQMKNITGGNWEYCANQGGKGYVMCMYADHAVHLYDICCYETESVSGYCPPGQIWGACAMPW
jgi:hypothetical protein